MRIIFLTFLFALFSGLAAAQGAQIGIIDFYGLRRVSAEEARAALQVKEGDTPSRELKDAAQKRLEALPHVEAVRLDFICCEAGKYVLYVGIREKGEPALQFRQAPNGAVRLNSEMLQAGKDFENALKEAVLKGDVKEDGSAGHALNSYPKLRSVQERFVTLAKKNLKLLGDVLRSSADAEHRALAAQIIAYAPDKRRIVKNLVDAMNDSNETVRNNSMRALAVIANFAQNTPESGIKVPLEPFVKMLNSIEWTDRNKSAFALFQLTAKREPEALAELLKTAFPALIEMARWKSPGHSFSPFVILGRVSGLPEEEIFRALENGTRESVIEKALKTKP